MAMGELKQEIVAAANNELNRANEKFPLFNSGHEGAAVIYEEALEELESSLLCLWDHIRGKETPCFMKGAIKPLAIAELAINLACEATQTAAMLMKFEMSIELDVERGVE